jgi:hypothetical protein
VPVFHLNSSIRDVILKYVLNDLVIDTIGIAMRTRKWIIWQVQEV